jgi:hypothetical protein
VAHAHAATGKERQAQDEPRAIEEHEEVIRRSGRSPWPGHGCSQELGRSMRACTREHAYENKE